MDHSEPIYVSVLTNVLTIASWCMNVINVSICSYVTTSWRQKYLQIKESKLGVIINMVG